MKGPGRIAAMIAFAALLSVYAYNDDEALYSAMDTLAEILVLTQKQSPQEVPPHDLVEGAISGLLKQLDPHSSYYDADRYQTMREDQNGAFFGIGVIVGYQNRRLTVVTALEGAPAAKAGIRPGDVIVGIDGEDTSKSKVSDAVRLLRGEEGVPVILSISRPGMDEPLSFVLVRSEIPTNNVRGTFMVDDKTGYVALKDFGEHATAEVADAVLMMEDQGMEQLVLDLRGNPGGLLPQAISVAGLFLPGNKVIVSTKGRIRNANREYTSERRSHLKQIPLIVLIDRGSASASEIVAGAIQDHDRGLIVGVNSWGKGLVQSVFPLNSGISGLALTTSRYYTPSGRNIQGSYDSWESYYSPKSSEQLFFSNSEKSRRPFKTSKGRQVYEERGITPDVFIATPEDPEVVRELTFRHAAFFNFAAVYQEDFGVIDRDWEAGDAVLDRFEAFLMEKKLPTSGVRKHRDAVRAELTYQFLLISGAGEGESWSTRHALKNDSQFQAALDLFDEARELLQVYNGEQNLRDDYTDGLIQYARMQRAQAPSEKVPQ